MNKGFTLVELITVIVLIGIISVFAVPRLSGSEAFSVMGARDAGLSVARQVQLRAMQQEDPSDRCNALFATATRMGGSSDTDCQWQDDRSDVVDLSDSQVRISPVHTFYFDLLGRPVSADKTRLCTDASGCKITLTQSASSASICLNSEGYFYACD
ncbi:type II secretion system protein [Enterovibrio norvegicus]|uniref:type II secretion system protein n=1 Tax=Enterovibrio norvegicus TaxID=188144 RepID=UPI0010BF3AEA|nr:prepilin-type N-terminal cleavage/methylation domain-containing protein [Enterovibrio norvegicus]TKF32749.1 type II secretion system protein [Enterovibrio norvegicus]